MLQAASVSVGRLELGPRVFMILSSAGGTEEEAYDASVSNCKRFHLKLEVLSNLLAFHIAWGSHGH